MHTPVRRPPRLHRSTRLVVLASSLAPGLLADSLDARAAHALPEQHVDIGHIYRLSTQTHWRARYCSGCDARPLDPSLDSVIIVDFIPDDATASTPLTIAGNSVFVPPVTGTLRNPRVDDANPPDYVREAAARYGCSPPYGELAHFQLFEESR